MYSRLILRSAFTALTALLLVGSGRAENVDSKAKPAPAVPNSECLDCHEAEFKSRKKGLPPEWIGVKPDDFARSVHGKLACVECHTTITEPEHPSKLPPAQCASCHEKTPATHAFHSRLALTPVPDGRDTSCAECHGTHETMAVKAKEFSFHGAQQVESCGRCHTQALKDFETSAHAAAPAAHNRLTPDCLTCHRESIASQGAPRSLGEMKQAQAALCESCHVGKPEVTSQANAGAKFVSSFENSVHGAALRAGRGEAANCIDCHGAHGMNKAAVAGSLTGKAHIPETCAQCHEKEATAYADSVHAIALGRGNLESAACTSCHGEHDIKLHTDPTAPVHKKNLARQVCAECHASVRLSKKYGLASATFQTFSDSYHGLAVRGGAVEVVNCASCHGVHAIKAQGDPASTVHKTNLAQTCGECHPGANQRFAVGSVHSSEERRDGAAVLYWISTLYVWLIVGVVGGMFFHNLADFVRKTLHKLAVQKGVIVETPVAHRLYLRMTVHERVQHGVLVLSFVVLVVTGFMLRYPEAWWVVAIRQISSQTFELRSLSHRFAGVVLLVSGVWHMGYLAFTVPGRKLFRDLLPRWRDVTDPWGVLQYNLGCAREKPAFGRFCYIEKAEYWALVWGTLLMGATGVILWFENTSIGYFTKLGFDISRTVHFYEAVLATLAIVVWHFYFVIFNPEVYPMNLAWLTGRMSEAEMREEHPLQLEAMQAAERELQSGRPPPPIPPEPAPPEAGPPEAGHD